MLHVRMMMCLGAYASSRQNTDDAGAGVVRSFDPGSITRGTTRLTSVCVQGDLKLCSIRLGPTHRVPVLRLQRRLRRLLRAVKRVAEGQENNRADPQGCSRRGDGVVKNFTISELGYRPGHLLITSPGSFASANRAHGFRLTLRPLPLRLPIACCLQFTRGTR